MNLTIYVPAQQQYTFFVYRTWIQGIKLEGNPMLGGTDILYNLLSKSGGASAAPPLTRSAGLDAVGGFGVPLPVIALAVLAVGGRKDR